ncbi:MAG: hypothetical protein CMF46_05600 [Legionellales bacterium]|nr:hypothetical protein [Legionellales bacterium]
MKTVRSYVSHLALFSIILVLATDRILATSFFTASTDTDITSSDVSTETTATDTSSSESFFVAAASTLDTDPDSVSLLGDQATALSQPLSIPSNSDMLLSALGEMSNSQFNLPAFIKAWADNFVYTLDQQYTAVVDRLKAGVMLTSGYPTDNTLVWKSYTTGLAQDKSISFLSSGAPILETVTQAQKTVQRKSQPLASAKTFIANLWLKGILFPAVSPVEKMEGYSLADPEQNAKCFMKALIEIHHSTDTELIYPSQDFSLSRFSGVDCDVYGSGSFSDTVNRFSDIEIDTLLGGISNGIYFDLNSFSDNTSRMPDVFKLYMSASYLKPMYEVCISVLKQLIDSDKDGTATNLNVLCEENLIDGPCRQCGSSSSFIKMYNSGISILTGTDGYMTKLLNNTNDIDIAFDKFGDSRTIISDVEAPLDTDSPLIMKKNVQSNEDGSMPLSQDFSAMMSFASNMVADLESLQEEMLPNLVQQIGPKIVDYENKVPFLSLDNLFAQDHLFEIDDMNHQLSCVGLDWDNITENAYTPISNKINEATIFLSNLSGDSAWSYSIDSPAAPLNFTSNTTIVNSPQPWPSEWSSQTSFLSNCDSGNPQFCLAWADNHSGSSASGQLTNSTVSSMRTKLRTSIVSQEQSVALVSLLLNKSIMSTSLYRELIDRSLNLHPRVANSSEVQKYCSPKMAKRAAAQWRLESTYTDGDNNQTSWVEELWLSDPATVLRHIAVMLAEMNLKAYELNESISNIDVAASSAKLSSVQSDMVRYAENVAGLSGNVVKYDAGRVVDNDTSGGAN